MARRAWGQDDRAIGPRTWKKLQALGLTEAEEPTPDESGDRWMVVRSADGGYAGSRTIRGCPGYLRWLLNYGIKPERAKPEHNTAAVGLGSSGRWYGWSHRAAMHFATRPEAVEFACEVS